MNVLDARTYETIAREWRGVKVPGHVQEVLRAAQSLWASGA